MVLFARLFVSSNLANWTGENGQLHWIGRWDGFSSLYNHLTLGLAWFCLLMTLALWFAVPARRPIILWMLAMLVGALAAFSLVFAALSNITDLVSIIGYTGDNTAGRYLFPMLLAWFATIITMLFARPPSANPADRNLPALKQGCWLAVGALIILVLGVFVLPKNKSTLPESPLQNTATTSSPNGSEASPPNNSDRQMELAFQLYNAGKFAEALQAFREAVRLYPNDPIALNNLAWCLAANPRQELRNGREAVQLAGRAIELTNQQEPVFIGTLAAAYAEDGQFAKADETAKKAHDIALLTHHPEMAAMINEQLSKLFSARKAAGLTNGP
jgi:tetratricopeptide (TPR) repeat protein